MLLLPHLALDMAILNLLCYQLRYGAESLKVLHVDDQVVADADILRVVQELEEERGLLVWENLDLLLVGIVDLRAQCVSDLLAVLCLHLRGTMTIAGSVELEQVSLGAISSLTTL